MRLDGRCATLLATLLFTLFPLAAGAQGIIPTPTASPSPSPTASSPPIAVDSGAADDARIAARIRGIFSQIPALRGTRVDVAAGVVTLSGNVDDATAIDQAQAIASRFSGVVAVQNNLQRDLEVGRNLDPAFSGVWAKLRSMAQALPLIAIALVVALAVIAAGYVVARQKRLWIRIAPNPFLAELLATAIRFAAIVGGLILALEVLDATALLGAVLGGAGVIGIAIGFAVRDSIDNYVSSLLLSIRQPFRANDSVKIDDFEGRVVRLHSRATVLMTADGNHLRIPNAMVFKAVIVNYSRNPKRRFSFDLTIDHGADPCKARNTAIEAMESLDFILSDPPPQSEIAEMPGTTQVLRFHGWVDQTQTDFPKARTAAIEAARSAIRQAGFILPDGRYLVHLEQDGDEPPRLEEAKPETEDVSAKENVAEMVKDERASDEGQDLLDQDQPEE